jgi:hypothetical protein
MFERAIQRPQGAAKPHPSGPAGRPDASGPTGPPQQLPDQASRGPDEAVKPPPPGAPDPLGRRLARAVLQRANLGQTGWVTEAQDSGRVRNLVGENRRGRVYTTTATAQKSKADALWTAAGHNARIGVRVDEGAEREWEYTVSNDKWTIDPQNFDRADFKAIDPFFYELAIPYDMKAGPTTTRQTMTLTFQHAASLTGYVVTVKDTGNTKAAAGLNLFLDEAPLHMRVGYSQTHDVTQEGGLLGQTYKTTEPGIDAYTKIAGEGARWHCEKEHPYLENNSIFYITERVNNPGSKFAGSATYVGVGFGTLWTSWLTVFGKRYDITDAEVAKAIRDGTFARQGHAVRRGFRPQDKDYDLEAGY